MSQPSASVIPGQRRPAGAAEITAIFSRFRGGTEALADIVCTLRGLALTGDQRTALTRRLDAMAADITLARTQLRLTAAGTA